MHPGDGAGIRGRARRITSASLRCGTRNDIDAVSTDPSRPDHTKPAPRSTRDRSRVAGRIRHWLDQHLVDAPAVQVDHLEPQIAANEGLADRGMWPSSHRMNPARVR